MKTTLLAIILTLTASAAMADAVSADNTAEKRSFILKRPGETCTMMAVTIAKSSGQQEIRQLRTCSESDVVPVDADGGNRSVPALPYK